MLDLCEVGRRILDARRDNLGGSKLAHILDQMEFLMRAEVDHKYVGATLEEL
jgi:hypothetical protein